ncbi:MAG: PD-(D/E)XK nuclease family protein [Clostridiales bacterium]|nr:PD-(D/E)XK nuclease family protein [Clostridiales bacterium]
MELTAKVRIVTTRAPGLLPSLLKETEQARLPVLLVPGLYTLACEQELIRSRPEKGFIGMNIYSPSSFIREVRELTGTGGKVPLSSEGQVMLVSQILHRHVAELNYYGDAVGQPSLSKKIADQINELSDSHLDSDMLLQFNPSSRRTKAKLQDLVTVWSEYESRLSEGYVDVVRAWQAALQSLSACDLLKDADLLIYGFGYISFDLIDLIETALPMASSIVVGLVCDDRGPDKHIFHAATDSLATLRFYLNRLAIPFREEVFHDLPSMDPGISYVENTIYAMGSFREGSIHKVRENQYVIVREDPEKAKEDAINDLSASPLPDMSNVSVYYARNSYIECLHTCQTLIEWHEHGVAWSEMAVALCEKDTLPSLLPLALEASGIPFNAYGAEPILRSEYAQYFLSLLRILRLRYRLNDVIRLIKTGLTSVDPLDVMDLENYARSHGIDRRRWVKPFPVPKKDPEKVAALEMLRQQLIEPLQALRHDLQNTTGKEAAERLFRYVTEQGVYEKLLEREKSYAASGNELAIDRNRQVWTSINDLLDQFALFFANDRLSLDDLCSMLESSLSAKHIRSLPQKSNAVFVGPPEIFFSSGIRRMCVMGLQENELSSPSGLLSGVEKKQLEDMVRDLNRQYFDEMKDSPLTLQDLRTRPYARLGLSIVDQAARLKQQIYQAVSMAREKLMLSCSSAKPNGTVLTPSTAFVRLARIIKEVNPANISGGLMQDGLHPFSPAFALERLAVMLRNRASDQDTILAGSDDRALLWQNALASLYHRPEWNQRVQAVLRGLHVSVKTSGITPEQASVLSLTNGMSVSRVQRHMQCPYMGFMESGLRLQPTGLFTYENNERGTFYHAVIAGFFNDAMKLPEWPQISLKDQTRLLNRVLHEETREWKNSVLGSDIVHQFQGAQIVRSVRNSIESMMRAFQKSSHFLPVGFEVGFGASGDFHGLHFPPVQVELSDGMKIAFSGILDRVDTVTLPDGRKYSLVVDNKSSSRDLMQNSIHAGLQLQLPVYMTALQQGLPGFQVAGGLYQPVKDVLIASEDEAVILNKMEKEMQASGMILDDALVQAAAMPVKIPARVSSSDAITVVSPDEMKNINQGALDVIRHAVEDIRKGNTSPAPVRDGQKSPCEFCSYCMACPFDSRMKGGTVQVVDHRKRIPAKQN